MRIFKTNPKITSFFLTFFALLIALTGFAPLALADSDRVVDAPRTQTAANGLMVTLVAPDENGPLADQNTSVLFRVANKSGAPVDGLQLSFVGVRDYSGQVDKEHNGPRDPNVGPMELKPTGKPGEYAATALFHNVGHWNFQLSGQSLGSQTLTFNQRIQANPGDNAGIRLDWLVWPGVLAVVLITLAVVGTRGEKIPVPAESEELVARQPQPTSPPAAAALVGSGLHQDGGK